MSYTLEIQYVIAICVRWRTNFYDFRFKGRATAAIGIHPTKAWLSQLVNFKNAIWHFIKTICHKNLFKLGKNTTETHGMLQTTFKFLSCIRDSRKAWSLRDDERCGRSKEVNTPELIGQRVRVSILRFLWSSGRDSVGRGQHSSNRLSGISTRTMHQSTTLSLSQNIWPRWASRQLSTLPIVQTLLPVTFAYFLSSEAVVMRQLRRSKRLWRRTLTRSHKTTFIGPSRSCWNGSTSALKPEEIIRRGLEFHVCTINRSADTKKVWKLIICTSYIYTDRKLIFISELLSAV